MTTNSLGAHDFVIVTVVKRWMKEGQRLFFPTSKDMMATPKKAKGKVPSISFEVEQLETARRSVAFSDEETAKMPAHCGLSALILAATNQLGALAEAATQCSDASDLSIAQISHGDGYASSHDGDVGMRLGTSPRSSLSDDGRHHSFPEVLMTLLLDPSNVDILTFLPDGRFFAMRSKEFAEEIMPQHFHVESFEEFLELVHDWGFTRIDDGSDDENTAICSGIQVFRHPKFHKGSRSYMKMKYGQSPADVRMSAIPDRSKIELSLSDDSMTSQTAQVADGSIKRRLSPGHLRRQSETSTTSQKQQKMVSYESDTQMLVGSSLVADQSMGRRGSMDSSGEHLSMSRRASLESRSLALAITTEKLNLEPSTEPEKKEAPATLKALVDDGVERATRNIVVDAIESLLWDEGHTRETYLKHQKELSTSTIPGVVPLSQQLFSPDQLQGDAVQNDPQQADPESGQDGHSTAKAEQSEVDVPSETNHTTQAPNS